MISLKRNLLENGYSYKVCESLTIFWKLLWLKQI